MAILDMFRSKEEAQIGVDDELISSRKAGEILGVSTETLRRWEKQGRLQAYWIGGKPQPGSVVSAFRGKKYKLADITRMVKK